MKILSPFLAKIEEHEDNIPRLSTLKRYMKDSVHKDDFIQMELVITDALDWKLILPTPVHFMEYYLIDCVTDKDLHSGERILSLPKATLYLKKYTIYFLEVSLQGMFDTL